MSAFQRAAEEGAGRRRGDGITVASKATAIYATYLEKEERPASTCSCRWPSVPGPSQAEPQNANAWYWNAALGRYSQGHQRGQGPWRKGCWGQDKESLEKAIALAPKHADAHCAGRLPAEVIDKVGALIGGMTYCRRTGTQTVQKRSSSIREAPLR